MARYSFVTRWRLDAPLVTVWEEINAPQTWPEWWKAVLSVEEIQSGDAQGLGSLQRFTWRGALPYRLTFDMRTTLVEPHRRIEGEASGELSGFGRWTFEGDRWVTRVRYDWEVEATKRWMRMASPLARPLFEWNHDVVMRWGREGLERRLPAPLGVHGAGARPHRGATS